MPPVISSPVPTVRLVCPDCRGDLARVPGPCTSCRREFGELEGVPVLLPRELWEGTDGGPGGAEARQRALYDHVAHEYDDVFHPHVAEHYLAKRTGVVKDVIPLGGLVLDVGCGTGRLGAWIASEGYDVVGVDLSPSMVRKAREHGLAGAYAAVGTALPFADDSFDLALTVATLHHLETPERVARTIAEMGRVVRPGGFVLLWDHNPRNPYWPILMKRVPQDSGDERLVPVQEIVADVHAAGLRVHRAYVSGFTPDFLPAALARPWRMVEQVVEHLPGLNVVLAAHNVVIARKPK